GTEWALDAGVFRSTDNGDHWVYVSGGAPYIGIVHALAINPSGGIFAGGSGIIRSTDNGNTWSPAALTDKTVLSLAINPEGHIFAGTAYGHVFRSTDNGANWTETTLDTYTFNDVGSLAINASGHIFAGINFYGGVFRSFDNGDSWDQINAGLTSQDVRSLTIGPSDYVFAATFGGGLCRSVLQTTTAVDEPPSVTPKYYVLSQNYHNPFHPTTTIRYVLRKREKVTLEIFDVIGQRVRVLIDEEQSAGEHTLSWDGKDERGNVLSSGLYVYCLKSGGFAERRKMLLLK